MQILALWTFGLVTILTVAFFGAGYPVARQVRVFWAWATGTEPPKEKMIVFLPLNLILGLIIGGFVQSIYDAGSMCKQYQTPLIPCTINVLGQQH